MIVTTYQELNFWVDLFKRGNCELLCLIGAGGLSKSWTVKEAMRDAPHCFINSHASPLSVFIAGYAHANEPIVFDDVDLLLANSDTVSLLKALCETTESKKITWLTSSPILENQEVPFQYETKSRVCLIINDLGKVNAKLGALLDRGFKVFFEPTTEEILTKMKEVMENYQNGLSTKQKDDVFSYVRQQAAYSDSLTLRTLIKGFQLYKHTNGQGWQEKVSQEMNINPKIVVLHRLLENLKTDKERIERWQNHGWSRSSYFEYKRKLVQKSGHI